MFTINAFPDIFIIMSSNNKKKRVFSGIQPSGDLHIGNYIGAISNWVRRQDEHDNIFCVVDLHAITVPQNPKKLQENILELTKVLLASGTDPKKSTLFLQSDRPEHSELAWILNCFTYFGEASRMTQFKEKASRYYNKSLAGEHATNELKIKQAEILDEIAKGMHVTVGLFDYPILQAADILLYDTDEVPVGEDQKQHIEITRDIAKRVNNKFGKLFVVPEPIIKKEGARIMNLTDPTKKMSKSDESEFSYINIRDDADTIHKKFSRAQTDSGKDIRFDKEKKPGISNFLNIMSAATNTSISELEKKYANSNYAQFKKDVADAVIEMLRPIQANLAKLDKDEGYVKKVLKDGAEKVAPRAQDTLKRVKKAVGLGL